MIHPIDPTHGSSAASNPPQYKPNKTPTAAPTGTSTDPKPYNENPCRQVCICGDCVRGSTQEPKNTAIKFDLSKLKQPSQTLHDSEFKTPCLGKEGPNNTGEKREAENTKPPQPAQPSPQGGKTASGAQPPQGAQQAPQPTPLPKPVDPNQPQKNMNLTAPQPTGKENPSAANNPPTTLNHAEPAPTGTMKSSNTPPMPTTTTPGQPNQSTGGFFTKILAQDLQQAAQPNSASVGQSSAQKSTPHSMSQTASNGSLAQPSSAPTGQTASNGSLVPSSNAPINQPHSTFANNMAQLAQQLPNINLSGLSSLQATPQGATTALQLTNTLLQMPPHMAMSMATAINQLPPLVLQNLTKLMNALPQSFSASNTIMVTTMLANLAHQVSPKMLSSIMTTLQDLGSNPAFKSVVNDPNKLAMMQALFMSTAGKELSQQDLLKFIGPLLKTAIGEDDETTKKDKKTKQAAKEQIIQFLDTYVSTAHAIWAEKMNLDKRKHQLKLLHKKAKQQFNRQQLLLNGKLKEEHHVAS